MPRTPDAYEGPRFEEETVYEPKTAAEVQNPGPGTVYYDSDLNQFVMRDASGTFNPNSAGSLPDPPVTGGEGAIVISLDGATYTSVVPINSRCDFGLVNRQSELLYVTRPT